MVLQVLWWTSFLTTFYYTSDGMNNLGGRTNSVAYETLGNLVTAAENTAWSGAMRKTRKWKAVSFFSPIKSYLFFLSRTAGIRLPYKDATGNQGIYGYFMER